jgi:hypothetical protein
MMKTKNKGIAALLCVVILSTLTGCQLARENYSESASDDKLIGVFITREHIGLFDKGRIYASLVSKTTTDNMGVSVETKEYVFEGIAGIPFITPVVQDEHGNALTFMSDEAISESHISHFEGDAADSVDMAGIIFVTPDRVGAYFANPVYQDTDGKVYLLPGSGVSASDVTDENMKLSLSLDEAWTITENGNTKTTSISIKITIAVMYEPESIAVMQMNANGNLVLQQEYMPGDLPRSIVVDPGTAFIVVETRKQNDAGVFIFTRSICSNDADNMETYYARDDGICVKCLTPIVWGN